MSSRDKLILLALLAFNTALKLLWLDASELAHDEPFTVYWSQQPLGAFTEMLRTENNPPLYFLLIKAWSALVPFEADWLRVPSAVFSALSVWPLYLLAYRLAGVRTALVASLLFTLSNYHFGFAHEVRAYSLFTLLATTGMWLLWRADRPDKGRRAFLGLAVVNALMVYTHFFGWLAIGVQCFCVLLLPELRSLRRPFFSGLAVTLVAFAPYLFIFASRLGTSVSQGTWLSAPVPEELYNMIWRWSNAPVLAIAFLVLIVVALFRSRLRVSGIQLALIWTFVPLFGMYLASYAAPMFLDRYLVYAAPGFALLVALSISGLRTRVLPWVAAVAVGGMAFTFTPWASGVRHPGHVVEVVDEWCAEDCAIEVVPAWYWLNYMAAEDLDQLKEDHSDRLHSGLRVPDAAEADVPGPTILVDASGDYSFAHVRAQLRAVYPSVDSTEADHRVWVYRFRR